MITQGEQKRKDAVKALINIAALEAFVLAAVASVFFYTNNLSYLVGGMVGSMFIFAPMFLRWAKEHGPAMKQGYSGGDKSI